MRSADGPTARIISRAEAQHGAIRWAEAEAEYVSASGPARRHRMRGENNHCIWVKAVLDRHFVHVEGDGSKGIYFLKSRTLPEEADSGTSKDRMVRLIEMPDPWSRGMVPGLIGRVIAVDGLGTVHVQWNNGSRLGLVPGVDRWEEIA